MVKKLSLSFLIVTVFLSTIFGQRRTEYIKWFSIAAKATAGNSVLLNTDIIDDPNISPDYLTPGYSYGGKFTFSYGNNHHFGLEYMAATFGQKYGMTAPAASYTKIVNMKATELTPLYRYMGGSGAYVEAGLKFSTFKSITGSNEGVNTARYEGDILDYYQPSFNSGIFGFGLTFQLHQRVHLSGGFRFAYSFTDIAPEETFYIADDYIYTPDYVPSASTNPVSARFTLEINYFFAFFGDASCGRGRLMFFQ